MIYEASQRFCRLRAHLRMRQGVAYNAQITDRPQ
jgi:hypothetical protein